MMFAAGCTISFSQVDLTAVSYNAMLCQLPGNNQRETSIDLRTVWGNQARAVLKTAAALSMPSNVGFEVLADLRRPVVAWITPTGVLTRVC